MAIESIPVQSIWTALRWIPGALLRWYFTREKLAGLIYCDVRPRYDSVMVDLGQSPTYQVWLQVINISPFEVELDRASFRFWCGGSILNASVLDRKVIAPGEITTIFIRDVIPDGHASQIAKNIDGNQFALEGNIEFNCSITPFAKNIGHLDGIRPRVINEQVRRMTDQPDAR